MIQLTESEYQHMQDQVDQLRALESAGVDNWEGYSMALEAVNEKRERRRLFNQLAEDIAAYCSEKVDEPAGRGAGFGVMGAEEGIKELVTTYIKEANYVRV